MTLILGLITLLAGIIFMILPFHMQMTAAIAICLGLVLIVVWILKKWRKGDILRLLMEVLAAGGVVVLVGLMSIILVSGESDWEKAEKSDYGIVLGAQVYANGAPSRILKSRLDAAEEFLKRNPRAICILSGGKGEDEPISEAECMYSYLTGKGIPGDRLLIEDRSGTTYENFLYSKELIQKLGGTKKPVTIISSEFHLRRASYIASAMGMETCSVAARTDQWFYRVNYELREVFAYLKTILLDDIK